MYLDGVRDFWAVVGNLKLVLLAADVCIEVGQFVITEGLGHMVTAGQSTMKLDDNDVWEMNYFILGNVNLRECISIIPMTL